jgi:hypothetical protein
MRLRSNYRYQNIITESNKLMEKIPSWDADTHLACLEVSGPLRKLQVHYCVHSSLLEDPILNQSTTYFSIF